MTKHDLASFALRLLGIYALIEALPLFQFLGSLVYMLRAGIDRNAAQFWALAIMMIPLLLVVTVGAVLFVFSRELAPRLVGKDEPLGMSSVPTGRDVQAIGFSIVAVMIFLRALPHVGQAIWIVFDAVSHRIPEPVPGRLMQNVFRDAIPAVIQLVLAIVLFLQARGLANLWHRIRTAKYGRIEDAGQGGIPTDEDNDGE